MSQAEDLLNQSSESDVTLYSADPSTEGHIVIGEDRFITVPDSLKRIAVQFDHNIETVTFDCPRYWDEHEMSTMKIYVNYVRSDGFKNSYPCDNVSIDENDPNIMHFDWTILGDVTEVAGQLTINVCIKKKNSTGSEINHWNSELCNELYISEGLEVYKSTDTSITITHGETFTAIVGIYDEHGNEYQVESNDTIMFTLTKEVNDGNTLLTIDIPIDTMKLVINPIDTESLTVGNYVYNIKLSKMTGEIYNVIANSSFILS